MKSKRTPWRGPRGHPRRFIAIGTASLMLLATGCSDGDGDGVDGLANLFTAESEVRHGAQVELELEMRRIPLGAEAKLFADVDGNLDTKHDQMLIAEELPILNNERQRVPWDTGLGPAGIYKVMLFYEADFDTQVDTLIPKFKLNQEPEVTVLSPLREMVAYEDGIIEIRYTDNDPDDVAITTIYADIDGLLTTDRDQFVISVLPDADGGERVVRWNTLDVPLDNYWIVAKSEDPLPGPAIERGPGRVELAPLYVRHLGSLDPDGLRIGGPVMGNAVHASAKGGAYVAGFFNDFLTQDGVTALLHTNPRIFDQDTFLGRYDEYGNLLWIRGSDTVGVQYGFDAEANDVAPLVGANVVIAGKYRGKKAFGPYILESSYSFPSGGKPTYDMFLTNYTTNGDVAWAVSAGGPGVDRAEAVIGLPDGAILVAGVFQDVMIFDANGPNQQTLRSAGLFHKTRDVFVARYEADGRFAWAQRAGGLENDDLGGLALLSDGTVLVAGSFRDVAGFGDAATGVELRSLGGSDAFVVRYGPHGALLSADSFGGPDDVFAKDIETFRDDSYVVVGQASGVLGFEVDSAPWRDPFIVRFGPFGNLQWVETVATTGGGVANGVTTTPDDALIVTGRFDGLATFDEEYVLWAMGADGPDHHDAFFARYESDGEVAWARPAGGIGDDLGLDVSAWQDGTAIATGKMKQWSRFHMGERKEFLPCYGSQDCFVYLMDAQNVTAASSGGTTGFVEEEPSLYPPPPPGPPGGRGPTGWVKDRDLFPFLK